MLTYQVRLAAKSLARNPWLALLMVGAIAIGIAVAMTFTTAYYHFSGDPIPWKSDRLFFVQLDLWDPARPYDDTDPTEPPDQLTYPDAMALLRSPIPTRQTVMYRAEMTVHPPDEALRPYREVARLCSGAFFPMFDVPFRYGAGWSTESDAAPEAVVVLDAEANQRLFGGEDSVGRTLRIEDRDFEVVGVLDRWRPMPRFYDLTGDEHGPPEHLFVPFAWGAELELYSAGNTSSWKSSGETFADFLQSEAVWLQMWVELDDGRQQDEYAAFLAAHLDEQARLGRATRPENTKLRDVTTWLATFGVVPEEATALLVISFLFLLVSSLNLIGILLGKFLARAPEVGVRRALGASRRWIFVQHLIECELIGVAGGLAGLALAAGSLRLIDRLFGRAYLFAIDWTMLGVGVALALLAALVAGVYPAWRVCRIPPGLHLKSQ